MSAINISQTLDALYFESFILLNRLFLDFDRIRRGLTNSCPVVDEKGNELVDVFIPVADKDLPVLKLAVPMARKNIAHEIGDIFIIGRSSDAQFSAEQLGCGFIHEDEVLPVSKADIRFTARGKDRSGWIFQQLLKLNADTVCRNTTIIVLDADTVLLQPTAFRKGGASIFYYSEEYNITYFRAFRRLFGRRPRCWKSFVSHMMVFEASWLQRMRQELETQSGKSWFQAILDCLEPDHPAPFSEYECYVNFFRQMGSRNSTLERYNHNISCRSEKEELDCDELQRRYLPKYRSVSIHVYP